MKHLTVIGLTVLFLLPVLMMADFTYLSEEEYQDLSRQERRIYNENLEQEYLDLQERKSEANARNEQYLQEINDLRTQIAQIESEYQVVYDRIIAGLDLTQEDIEQARQRLERYKSNIEQWSQLSDSELWENVRDVRHMIAEYEEFKETDVSKAPDFRDDIVEIDRGIENLEAAIERAEPRYYEDQYTVERGDYLARIAGYSFIYDDSSKWGIIYRANRDKITDPNLIYVDQVLQIPRGLPNTWEVYRGESLWRIASYPEIYGSGLEWPRIFRENEDQIQDPDLIYPGQIFRIPRN